MPHVGSEIDANFYRLIHRMLETPRDGQGPERRSASHRAYLTAQRIARWDGSRFPDESQFVPIQCRDLTRSGFSFLASTEPRFTTLVVEFGVPPHVLYVAAQVLRSIPVTRDPSGAVTQVIDGHDPVQRPGAPCDRSEQLFLVGCRFTRRLHKPA
jgi:hypothetical protein